ncbi:DUF4148 domain-containing protein [Caballeronia sp. Lep1P3]|uniref:DUF4148 domain-containing protein n=1 Tax=Caballeronia sp. Lep1P3 TaxID=2878150 RepID=UPI001FD526C5|nr:DUF4148 domain-containing protein [Caballeronia sp. Lep1P3]
MKKLFGIAALAVALSTPVASFAQSNQPVTRAQVRAELVELEQAGYTPSVRNDPSYPADLQAAEARIAAKQRAYGGASDVTAQSGARVTSQSQANPLPTFAHH